MSVGKTVRRILDVHETEAPFVQELFARAAAGESTHSLSAWVAALPAEARGRRTLVRSSVNRALRNPLYVARYDRGEADTPEAILEQPRGRWPALVKDDVWRAVQRRLESHQRLPRQASGEYLLTGFIYCPHCGGARMNAHFGKQQKETWARQSRYRCVSYLAGAGKVRCTYAADMPQTDADVLRQVSAVVDVIARLAHTDERVVAAARKTWARLQAPKAQGGTPQAKLQRDIAQLRKRLAAVRERLYDESITREEYDADAAAYREQLQAKEAELARVAPEVKWADSTSLPDFDEALASAETVGTALASLDVRSQREALVALIERVEPVRVGYGKYEARIQWTPLGDALRGLADGSARR